MFNGANAFDQDLVRDIEPALHQETTAAFLTFRHFNV
jgi:hypothetical protein